MPADLVQLQPNDEHNQKLESHVHPPDWTNPTPSGRYNLVVIGAGAAGLITAAGAAGLGAKVALVERELLGQRPVALLRHGCRCWLRKISRAAAAKKLTANAKSA